MPIRVSQHMVARASIHMLSIALLRLNFFGGGTGVSHLCVHLRSRTHVCVHVHTEVHTHVYMHVSICVLARMLALVRMCASVHVRARACVYARMFACVGTEAATRDRETAMTAGRRQVGTG